MKKKLLLTLVIFLCCFTLTGYVGAEGAWEKDTEDAKIPETVPESDQTLSAILDDTFDFSKISFSNDAGGTIQGKDDIRKILITANPNKTGEGDIKGESWFSVYCLDGSLKYPQYGIYNNTATGGFESLSDELKIQTVLRIALFNNKDFYNVFKTARGYVIDPTIKYADDTNVTQVLTDIEAKKEVTVNIESITYSNVNGDTKVITPAMLTGNDADLVYQLKIVYDNILFDQYTPNGLSDAKYAQALWIIEHSYPTLNLKASLEAAGADYYNALYETAGLENHLDGYASKEEYVNTFKKLEACTAKAELATEFSVQESEVTTDWCNQQIQTTVDYARLDDYVYSTVQYAIWKTTDGIDNSNQTLGSTLTGSSELAKLYSYLIQDRSVYDTYLNYEYGNTIEVTKPKAGSEIFKDTTDAYVYGPYTVNHKLYDLEVVNLSLANAVEGVKFLAEDGIEITNIVDGGKFYISVPKAGKTTQLDIRLTTDGAYTFFPATNKGRVYYAHYANAQNVVSGGKIVEVTIEKDFRLDFNPKTGDQNIGVIFVIALIVASLGFVFVSVKGNPLKLN